MHHQKIKGFREFHESYYEHSCSIHERNKDVLKTDIPGKTFTMKMKRWWYGLFLVSYSDERCRAYYTSSEAMRLDRIRQFRNFRGRIHPLSKFRSFWDIMMLILFIANNILLHHNTSAINGQLSDYFYIAGPMVEIIIIADVFISLKTGFIADTSRKVILDTEAGVIRFCSTKLFLHVASAIPVHWIMYLRYGKNIACEMCKANFFVLTLRLMGIFALVRLFESSIYLTRERHRYPVVSCFRFFRIILLGVFTVLFIQDICDKILFMIMVVKGQILDSSHVESMMYLKYVHPDPLPNYTAYIFTWVRAFRSVFLYNFRGAKNYYLDKLVLIMVNVVVYLFYLRLIMEVYAFLCKAYFCESIYYKERNSAYDLACYRQLPDRNTKRILKYFDSSPTRLKVTEIHNIFYNTLPEILRNEMFLTSYFSYVKRIPYFSEWPINVVQNICLLLQEEIFLSNDLVAEPYEQSDGLLILATGELAVYDEEIERGHLIDGDYFGELSLITDKEMRTSKVVAITNCVVLLLDKVLFRRYMRENQELYAVLEQDLKNKFTPNK